MASLRFIISVVLLVVAGATQINGVSKSARLLTPEEGCGYSKVATTRIVGGTEAKIGAWPWMALLGYTMYFLTPVQFGCGGSLITTRHVLTAAHCIHPELWLVRLGEHDTTTTTDGPHKDMIVKYADKHEEFNADLDINDIAIIHLFRDVEFTDRIRPICLPFSKDLVDRRFVDSNAFLVGWGRMHEKNKGGMPSTVPMQVQIPVVKNKDCKKSYRRIGRVQNDIQFDDRVVCAGLKEGGKDSCQGDSGGPLVLPIAGDNGTFPFYQIGIVSYAEGCARPNLPGVNTNVQFFASWINEKLIDPFDLLSEID